jgi:hypothetical protein
LALQIAHYERIHWVESSSLSKILVAILVAVKKLPYQGAAIKKA